MTSPDSASEPKPASRGARVLKALAIVLALGLGLGLAIAVPRSTLVLQSTTATFSKGEGNYKGLNRLSLKIPYGAWVYTYQVNPPGSYSKQFRVGGSVGPWQSTKLFKDDLDYTNHYPDTGTVEDIGFDEPVQLTRNLSMSSVVSLPKDQALRDRGGMYILISREPIDPEAVKARVAAMTGEE